MVNARLHRFVDKKRVRDAIVRAEEATSAPIAVSIVPHVSGDVHAAALRALRHRGLSRAPDRNAVHFFVVPSRREFAVVGDAGAHERLGQETWNGVAATVEKH
ncbi:MAG TPA: TPM domain-containing protein, partial [Xanthomonadales bacterium]|nr:TPM domain-containing protein [Xanthomonadales bacterium]